MSLPREVRSKFSQIHTLEMLIIEISLAQYIPREFIAIKRYQIQTHFNT